jgi:hypothetical protein
MSFKTRYLDTGTHSDRPVRGGLGDRGQPGSPLPPIQNKMNFSSWSRHFVAA